MFDQATSVAPLTLPAHTSLFTGLVPPRHGVRDNADPPLRRHAHNACGNAAGARLPDRRDSSGRWCSTRIGACTRDLRRTAASARTGSAGARQPAAADGLGRERGDSVARRGRATRRSSSGSHLYDAHRPYDPPEPLSRRVMPTTRTSARSRLPTRRLDGCSTRSSDGAAPRSNSVFIVAGDHGESLGEHGETDHGIFIYENVLRVPLIIRRRVARANPRRRRAASGGRSSRRRPAYHIGPVGQARAAHGWSQPGRPDRWNRQWPRPRGLRGIHVSRAIGREPAPRPAGGSLQADSGAPS